MRNKYIIISGIDGGRDEYVVKSLSDKIKSINEHKENKSLFTFKFPDNYNFSNLFELLDTNFLNKINDGDTINIIAHSFSAVISIYYVDERKQILNNRNIKINLITIDYSNSREAINYIDSLTISEKEDINYNPFSIEVIDYMRAHDTVKILESFKKYYKDSVIIHNTEAKDIDASHEFETAEEMERLWTVIERFLVVV